MSCSSVLMIFERIPGLGEQLSCKWSEEENSKKFNIVLQDCACLSVIQYISQKIRLLEQVCEVRSNIFNER